MAASCLYCTMLLCTLFLPTEQVKTHKLHTQVLMWKSSMYVRKSIMRFGLLAEEETVEIGNMFVAFIVTINKPQMYAKILWSPNREE